MTMTDQDEVIVNSFYLRYYYIVNIVNQKNKFKIIYKFI